MYPHSKALIYFRKITLAMLLGGLFGCDHAQPQAIVTLHHIKADTLQETLAKSLGPNVKFSITENKIIIFESLSSITSTLELLKSLDVPSSILSLQFRKIKQYDYSTLENPEPFYIKENKETKIIVSNEIIRVMFKRSAANAFTFKMATKNNRKVDEVVFEITEGDWKKINLKGLKNFPMLRVQQQH